jgi:hypothetical protein
VIDRYGLISGEPGREPSDPDVEARNKEAEEEEELDGVIPH